MSRSSFVVPLTLALLFALASASALGAQGFGGVEVGTRVRLWLPEPHRQVDGPPRRQLLRGTVEGLTADTLRLSVPGTVGIVAVPRATVRRLEQYEARGILASVTGLVERNTTTNLLDPQDGSVLAVQAEQAGGDFSLWRLTAEAKRYWPVLGRRVLAARLRVGVADSYGGSGDVPLFRRFYAGGINSTRGYDRWKLGPLSTLDDPVGGRTLLEGSVELRTPIWGKFGGVVFVDVGEVRRQPFTLSASDLQFGAGVGVRYQTLIGPLRLDVGIPFPDAPRGEPSWQIHFSIGQAF